MGRCRGDILTAGFCPGLAFYIICDESIELICVDVALLSMLGYGPC